MLPPRKLEGRELAHRRWIEELGNDHSEYGALEAIGVIGGNPEALYRFARLDLGAVIRVPFIVTLRKRANVRPRLPLGAEPVGVLDHQRVASLDQVGRLLGSS